MYFTSLCRSTSIATQIRLNYFVGFGTICLLGLGIILNFTVVSFLQVCGYLPLAFAWHISIFLHDSIWLDMDIKYTYINLHLSLVINMHLFPFSLQCSYYPPCKSSRIANEKAVHDYEQKFGTPGKTYPCLYNPHNPKEVIRTRRFHLSHVIHGMVWSSLVFLISLGILIFAVKKKGCDFVWIFSSSCLVQLSTAFFPSALLQAT